jgi:hypothetical protein
MNNFYNVIALTTLATIVSACTTAPNVNNMRVPTSQTYQPAIVIKTSEKKQILGIVKNFATSVACSTSFNNDAIAKTTVNDVFLVGTSNLGDSGNNYFNSDYLVYWSGDIGCSGGNADSTSFMTLVNRFSDTSPFLIETDFGRDDIRHEKFFSDLGIYPRFVSEVDYKNGVFSIISSHDNNDGTNGWIGNNSPRYKYQYTVTGDVSEGWKVVEKKLLADYKTQ